MKEILSADPVTMDTHLGRETARETDDRDWKIEEEKDRETHQYAERDREIDRVLWSDGQREIHIHIERQRDAYEGSQTD